MAIANLRVPISALPSAAGSTSWLGALNTSVGDALDHSQDLKQARDYVGAPQQQGFLSRLVNGPQPAAASAPTSIQTASVAAPGTSSEVAAVKSVAPPAAAPDGTALGGYLSDPTRRAHLPAGMRNNNPGNIKFVGQNVPGIVGPSQNTDEGDPQAVFATPEAGMAAMHSLLLKKYNGGKVTADQIIAGNGGWTPGNHEAAANVARYAGLAPNQDIDLNNPTQAAKFMRGLMMQEHGNSSRLYPDSMILSAVGGQQPTPSSAVALPTQVASLDPSAGVSGDQPPAQPGYVDPAVTTAFRGPAAVPPAVQAIEAQSPGSGAVDAPSAATAYAQPNAGRSPMTMATQNAPGLIAPGNIDLSKRPVVNNPDGSISTVRSVSFNIDGKEVLVPTVSPDGRILSDQDALKLYQQTGQNLGVFDNADSANAYAESLHNQQAGMYAPQAQQSGGYHQPNAQPQTAQPPIQDGNAPPPLPTPSTPNTRVANAPQQSTAPQQVAQNTPQTLAAGVTPIPRGGVNTEALAQMLANPRMRDVGIALWKQNAGKSGDDPWQFIQLPDGTLGRGNRETGELQALGNFQSSKKNFVPVGKSLYNTDTGEWVTPPAGAEGAGGGEYGLNPIFGTDATTGKTGIGQIGKDGSFHLVDTGGFQPVGNVSNTNLGTMNQTRDKAGNVIAMTPIDNRGKATDTRVGEDTAAAKSSLPTVLSASDQLIATIDSLTNDQHLDSMLGPWKSRMPTLTADGERVQAKMDQIGGQTFLQAYNTLRGAGAITDVEGDKATKSLTRLNKAQSPQDYRAALSDFRNIVVQAAEIARQKAEGNFGAPAPNAPDPLGIR